eukprot:GHVN01066263.1.p1 GENE.GHVN01066263.1~~GHVN01066263.1.p1  ORF type:complete len:546 (-),score=45.12 GHVN01066263.1:26-1663(-)
MERRCFVVGLLTLVTHTLAYGDLPDCGIEYDFNNHPNHCIPKAILKCPPGMILVEGSCLKTVFAEQTIKCPLGSQLNGKECVTRGFSDPVPMCPPGTVLSGGKRPACERLEVIPAVLQCDEGFRPFKGECAKTHKQKAHTKCPAGYRKGHHGGACVKEVVAPAKHICPHGHEFSTLGKKKGEECAKIITVPAANGCAKDYFPHGSQCIKEEKVKITKSCPKGFTQDGNFCIQTLQHKAETDCPLGYHLKGFMCEAVVTAAAFPVCPKHYEVLDGVCQRERKHSPNFVCPKEATFVDGDCVTRNYVPNELVCPPGSWLKGGQYCVSAESVPAELRCPLHYSENGGECVKTDKKPHKHRCDHGFGLSDDERMCERLIKVRADSHCDGGKLIGSKCEAIEEVRAEKICRLGEIDQFGNCVTRLEVAPEGYCRKGFSLPQGSRGMCQRTIKTAPDTVCPAGSDFKIGKCAVCTTHAPEITCPKKYFVSQTGGCQQTVTAKPSFGCPASYVIDKGMCFPAVEGNLKKGGMKDGHGLKHRGGELHRDGGHP